MSQPNSQKNEYLSLSEASRLTGYHQDYLSSLCRQGKLQGVKIGRNWLVTQTGLKVFLNTSNKENFIKPATRIKVNISNSNQLAGEYKIGNSSLELQSLRNTVSALTDRIVRIEHRITEANMSVGEHRGIKLYSRTVEQVVRKDISNSFISNFDSNFVPDINYTADGYMLSRKKVKQLYSSFKNSQNNLKYLFFTILFFIVVTALCFLILSIYLDNLISNSTGVTQVYY